MRRHRYLIAGEWITVRNNTVSGSVLRTQGDADGIRFFDATCLAVVAAQLVGGVTDLGSQALYARLDDRIPRRASGVASGVILLIAA